MNWHSDSFRFLGFASSIWMNMSTCSISQPSKGPQSVQRPLVRLQNLFGFGIFSAVVSESGLGIGLYTERAVNESDQL